LVKKRVQEITYIAVASCLGKNSNFFIWIGLVSFSLLLICLRFYSCA